MYNHTTFRVTWPFGQRSYRYNRSTLATRSRFCQVYLIEPNVVLPSQSQSMQRCFVCFLDFSASVFQSQRIAWSHVYDSLWCFEEHLEVLPLSACICCMLLRKPSPTFASTPAAPQKVWTAEWDLWTSMEVPIATVRMSHGQNRST